MKPPQVPDKREWARLIPSSSFPLEEVNAAKMADNGSENSLNASAQKNAANFDNAACQKCVYSQEWKGDSYPLDLR